MVRMSRRHFLGKSAVVLGGLLAAACDLWPPSTPSEEASGAVTAVPPRPPTGAPTTTVPPRTVQMLVTWSEWLDAHSGVLGLLARRDESRRYKKPILVRGPKGGQHPHPRRRYTMPVPP